MFLSKSTWLSLNDYVLPSKIPKLPCPYCSEEFLTLEIESISSTESPDNVGHISLNKSTAELKKQRAEIAQKSDFLKILMVVETISVSEKVTPGVFTSTFCCEKCGETVRGIGSAKFRTRTNQSRIVRTLEIKHEYFCPSIPLFKIPSSVPERIVVELLQTFNYFHSDISTAGFKLRRTMEKVCEELGYRGKSLHHCIDLMAQKHDEEATWLKTLKLVGNEATHADGVNASDLLDAFEIFPGILNIFERRQFSMKAAEKIPLIQNKFGKKIN